MSTTKQPTLDHVAIGVRQWSNAYDRFVHELGGSWVIGGPGGEFAPFQLSYGVGMQLEFIAPRKSGGFMDRFLDRHGPSAHHVTFQVPSLPATVRELSRFGLDTFHDRPDLPMFRELFVHPKHTGLGTLLQLVEKDEAYLSPGLNRPADFPTPRNEPRELALFGLTVPDLARTSDLLGTILAGTIADKGDGWFFITWGPGRSILVRDPDTAPCDSRLWSAAPAAGVGFILFAPSATTASELGRRNDDLKKMPPHAATGIPVWLLED
jgi:hypothetical protein